MYDLQAARGATLRRHTFLGALVAAACLGADQATKIWAVRELTGSDPRPLIGEVLRLNLTYNPGAAFGLGGGFTVAISLLAILASCVAVWALLRAQTTTWALAVGLGLAGVLGNLLDRLLREPGPLRGHVVDFLQLPRWPIFNIADICINAAAILVLVQFVRGVQFDGTREPAAAERSHRLQGHHSEGSHRE